jgi:hypothetical protein
MARTAPLAVALLLAAVSPAAAAGKVTLEGLLRQMTDLSVLCEFPDPPYVAKQFSSYERLSETPKDHDRWFANYDRGFPLYDGVVTRDTPYYTGGPMQMKPPDGTFKKGTKVGLAPNRKPIGEYVWAYATAADGGPIDGRIPQGYVEKSAIRMDPQGHVLAEMDGPGCVTRIWSANPDEAGHVRIYLDGDEKPVIEAPLTTLLGGKWKTMIGGKETTAFPDPIACERSRGYNLYFPIAYQKHCKITIDKPDIYYHVDYRTYPKGTEVETFSLKSLARLAKQVTDVQVSLIEPHGIEDMISELMTDALGEPGNPPPDFKVRQGGKFRGYSRQRKERIAPGKSVLLEAKARPSKTGGAQAVRHLHVLLNGVKDEAAALRGLVLVARFDGTTRPQIWCPLGDFFGSAPGFNGVESLPLGVAKEKDKPSGIHLHSYWWMPFEKSVDFEIRNLGTQTIEVLLRAESVPYRWSDRSMHFHARWRTQTMNTRPFRDWTYCDLKGKGVYVGNMLSILNPVTAWWGEGDEKVYVDGEKFPSWFGTGTEDYYGYAWSDPRPFQHAYHNQTRCDGPGTKGWTSLNRFHILDAIPFTKSFKFDMEVWHWTPNIDVTCATTNYWYARPGATDDFPEVDPKVLQHIPSVPPPYRLKGAIEGEALKVLRKSSDFDLGPQDMTIFPDGKWSGESHLWGRPPKAGEWADLELPVPADGKYRVVAYLTKARDYGVVQFHLDGKPLGKPIDGYNSPAVVNTGPIDLGEAELKKGPAKLRVEVVGTNEKSVGLRYMWGLDCVLLRPAGN